MHLYRSYSASMIFIVMLTQTMGAKWSIVELDFYINRAAYERLCENKFNPSMECGGHCLLKKKLQSSTAEEHRAEGKIEKKDALLFVEPCLSWVFSYGPLPVQKKEAPSSMEIFTDYYGSIFHPPKNLFA